MPDQSILHTSFRLGSLELANRIVMAPLTRNRATPDTLAPNDLIATYYRQRASADVKALARQHIDELNQKIRELGELRDTLQDLVEHCNGDHRPDCPILKELASGCCAQPARA